MGDELAHSRRGKGLNPLILNWGWGYLEADFQRFYAIDLNRSVFKNHMSLRRLMILVRGLPPESNFARFYHDKSGRAAADSNIDNITFS